MGDLINNFKAEINTKAAQKGVAGDDFTIGLNQKLSSNEEEIKEKWSSKYKKSIDCNNPKGFSQRAHCQGRKKENKEATGAASAGGYSAPLFSSIKRKIKEALKEKLKGGKSDEKTLEDIAKKHDKKGYYDLKDMMTILKKQLQKGIKVEMEHTTDKQKAKEIAMDHLSEDPKYYDKLKKMETKEATSTSSSGSYETPAAWAKSMSKKNWRGRSKTQIPGGKFVTVKNKCKTFPYCNQGDIKSLKIYENEVVRDIIKNISKKHNISENVIKSIIQYEIENYKNNSKK
jgi:hypothetical protein